MNAIRLAVAATALLTLCGTAGAETMTATQNDPLAVPVSGHDDPAAKRAAQPWTPERLANAQPKPMPEIDPASVRAASGRFRSGTGSGPTETTTPAVVAGASPGPIDAQVPEGSENALEYWTPERMRAAKPMPSPQLTEEQIEELMKAAKQKNR